MATTLKSSGSFLGREVRLLLDTHIALWAITADPRLPKPAEALIADPDHTIFISSASIWEIAIKHALARDRPTDMPVSGPDALAFFRAAGYRLLPIMADHAAAVAALPNLHKDPFDRIIIAQSLTEPLRLLTHDPVVKAYSECIVLF